MFGFREEEESEAFGSFGSDANRLGKKHMKKAREKHADSQWVMQLDLDDDKSPAASAERPAAVELLDVKLHHKSNIDDDIERGSSKALGAAMQEDQLENSTHSTTDYNIDEDEVLGCMHGLYRDIGDMWLGWFLYLTFVGMSIYGWLGVTLVVEPMASHFLWIVIPYSFKVLEGFFSPTFAYLYQAQTIRDMIKNDVVLRDTDPTVVWGMVCSHQETRTTIDSDGHTQTETVTVITHTAQTEVSFKQCRDHSPALPKPDDLTKNDITKYESDIIAEGKEYKQLQSQWITRHSRDISNSYSEHKNLRGLKKHSLLFRGEDLKGWFSKKLYVNIYVYGITLLSGYLGMPYRMFLSSITDKYHFNYHKELTELSVVN